MSTADLQEVDLTVEKRHRDSTGGNSDLKKDVENTAIVERQPVLELDIFDDPNIDKNAIGLDDDSPYPEVRSAVANTDDPSIPVSTLRAWVLGIIWAILLPGINQFFFFRFPAVTVSSLVAQLLSYPLGRAWAAFLPNKKIFGIEINPGPFSIKEHVIVTIMAGVGGGSAYATDIIAVQRVYYNQTYNFMYQWLVVMSTQLIGFSIGGIGKRFLVAPPSMIWPANLVLCALFNTLHQQTYSGMGTRGGVSRERFFIYVFGGATCYYFFPGYIFTALSFFSWWYVSFRSPLLQGRNIESLPKKLNQLFGYNSGLGMSTITFDWTQITYTGSPLATPWWAEANIFAGFLFFFWFLTPILYYKNVWFSAFMPILSSGSYDNTGAAYNVTNILTPDATLDVDKYHSYSPLFLSTTFAISYGLSFAGITSTIVHAFLYFRKQIWVQARRALHEQPDIHARLMSRYPQVPEWWYAIIFVSMFVFGVITIEVWPTQMPVWALVLALIIAFVYIIPIGMIQAITNQQVGLNVITELIIGYALPGRPIAMMMFKTWGYITMVQALNFTSDFKLGHYMKIPPRPMFWCQVVATVIAGTVQLGVQAWMFTNIPDMCQVHQKDGFTCPSTKVFFTASVIWGVIGPKLQFSQGQTYYVPVIFNGTGLIPPATAENYVPWALIGFIFQYVIRRRHFSWWSKYNCQYLHSLLPLSFSAPLQIYLFPPPPSHKSDVLSAALDSSVAVGAILVFFCLQFPRNGTIGATTIETWWGNTVYMNTADWNAVPLKSVPEGGFFGYVS
ncbi:hypothetical protein EW145_g7646 [Phellinidium pouzarii]|uniref:OPT family small oligopeptide transporter n=1 Tax=Phellinidium pouzarii TaxID=167371 RepID=A0A4S4KGN2_9AGAM|nr:hypothetical protein EW145_g7646 [Phellinidium pouzarii]